MNRLTKTFSDIRMQDVAEVGGKNASLGEMFALLTPKGIRVPDGFAVTSGAFWHFIDSNHLRERLQQLMQQLDRKDFLNLKETGNKARQLISQATMPTDLAAAIGAAYRVLGNERDIEVAVRSSATAEDLPNASFAGQHESYLNVKGTEEVLEAVQRCYASLYTDRAIKYREDKGFDHNKIALSVGVQYMVRSDKACSGIGFTLDPESGFRDVVHLSGVWGLGENIVQGTVTPDEFFVFKPTLLKGKNAIIQKKLGSKEKTMVYSGWQTHETTTNIDTPAEKTGQFVLTDDEITKLAQWALLIELHYYKPMDIEWAKDGITGELFIIQARPETVHASVNTSKLSEYRLQQPGERLAEGQAIGSKVATGIARILLSPGEAGNLQPGEVVVTDLTSPDWDPILKKAAAIVTNKGGRTSHAPIVARELGVPAIVGTGNATTAIQDGEYITVSCCEGQTGYVYKGKIPYTIIETDVSDIHLPAKTKAMMIVGDPDKAFEWSFYPNNGVGLMRLEFIITHYVKVHPMALVKFHELKDEAVKQKIATLTRHYPDKEQYFVDKLAQGIAMIAAAFYPKEVIVRMSDFKTNEYANLVGGKDFEPEEENPMLGFRGASRYYNDLYKPGFKLECAAINRVRKDMGLTNVKVMIPFCRTVEEGRKVIGVMHEFGVSRVKDTTLEIYVMAEIPSNVLQAREFAQVFDGFSIGSNDLTQLTLGIDRDSALVANLFNEQNQAAKTMIGMMIGNAKQAGVKVGLCGQAPSDFPEFARYLVEKGIDSISFNQDALLKGIENINLAEAARHEMSVHEQVDHDHIL
jgi:pyruvate,water dikinase